MSTLRLPKLAAGDFGGVEVAIMAARIGIWQYEGTRRIENEARKDQQEMTLTTSERHKGPTKKF